MDGNGLIKSPKFMDSIDRSYELDFDVFDIVLTHTCILQNKAPSLKLQCLLNASLEIVHEVTLEEV